MRLFISRVRRGLLLFSTISWILLLSFQRTFVTCFVLLVLGTCYRLLFTSCSHLLRPLSFVVHVIIAEIMLPMSLSLS